MSIFFKGFFFFLFISSLYSQAYAVSETQIKAVFLEKFTHLIQWPENKSDKFIVCVLKDKKFAKALNDIYKTKKFKKLPVEVIILNDENNIPTCQLLFLGKSTRDVYKVLLSISGKPVLTVSDNKENVPENVMITMFLNKSKFKYIINNKSAKASTIQISHLLLRSAQEVIK